MSQEQEISEKMKEEKHKTVCGGWTKMTSVKSADSAEVKRLKEFLEQVREPAQLQAGRTFTALEPLEFATQVVAGLNYRIKAYTGDGINAIFGLYQPIYSQTVKLTSYTEDKKTETDAN